MTIDIIFILLFVFALFKGYSKGLVIAVFSVMAFIVGIAAAMKLSVVVAHWLEAKADVSGKWLPFASFLLVFIGVVLLVRLGAGIIEKSLKLVLLGWLNRIAGILLYILLYSMLLSVLLFYAGQLRIISPEIFASSWAWPFIRPLGPWTIEVLGKLIPFFKDMFQSLQIFFEGISHKVR